MRGFKIFTGSAHPLFARELSKYLDIALSSAVINRFSDGEINVKISESVRGKDIYIIQPTCKPTNDNLMELLIMVDAFKRSSANNINAVIPYFGYARQDRKAAPRVPISAMSMIIGCVFAGISLATVFSHNGSTGGTDIIAASVNKYHNVSLGTVLIAADFCIIGSCMFFPQFGTYIERAHKVMFGFCVMAMENFVLDYVMNARRVFIGC